MPVVPAKPVFKGRVTYPPNASGVGIPVANARVRIWDKDAGADDLLVDVRTDALGRFSRQAIRQWQDTIQIPSPFGPPVNVPDVIDVPLFVMRVEANGKTISGPFPYLGDRIESPILVPWTAPPDNRLLKINDLYIEGSDSPDMVWEVIKDSAEAGQPIEIQFAGALVAPYQLFLNMDLATMRSRVCSLLNIDPNSRVLTVNPAAEIILANAVIIGIIFVGFPLGMSIGAFGVCCGVAILLAVSLGYRVEITEGVAVDNVGGVPIPLTNRIIKLNPPPPCP